MQPYGWWSIFVQSLMEIVQCIWKSRNGCHFETAAILKISKVGYTLLIDALFMCEVWLRSVHPFPKNGPDKSRTKKGEKIINKKKRDKNNNPPNSFGWLNNTLNPTRAS